MAMIRSLLLLACLALCPPASLAEEALQELVAGAVARQDKAAAGKLTKQAVRNAGKLEREALYATAQAAVFAERIADAHFLYHAGQMRERAELAAFPPIDPRHVPAMQDGLRQQTAEAVDPLMVSHSQTFIEAVKRLQKWQPAYPKNYKPDWLFDATRGKEISAAVEQIGTGSDGKIYYVLSSESYDVGGKMFCFDPKTRMTRCVGDITEACGEKELRAIPQGKIHVNFCEAKGKLYFATHIGVYAIID